MHRLMMTSDAYQMASDDIEANLQRDPITGSSGGWDASGCRRSRARPGARGVGFAQPDRGRPAVYPTSTRICSNRARRGPGPASRMTTPPRGGEAFTYFEAQHRYPMFELFDQPDMVSSCARRQPNRP